VRFLAQAPRQHISRYCHGIQSQFGHLAGAFPVFRSVPYPSPFTTTEDNGARQYRILRTGALSRAGQIRVNDSKLMRFFLHTSRLKRAGTVLKWRLNLIPKKQLNFWANNQLQNGTEVRRSADSDSLSRPHLDSTTTTAEGWDQCKFVIVFWFLVIVFFVVIFIIYLTHFLFLLHRLFNWFVNYCLNYCSLFETCLTFPFLCFH
jgi:hypothetical protein